MKMFEHMLMIEVWLERKSLAGQTGHAYSAREIVYLAFYSLTDTTFPCFMNGSHFTDSQERHISLCRRRVILRNYLSQGLAKVEFFVNEVFL